MECLFAKGLEATIRLFFKGLTVALVTYRLDKFTIDEKFVLQPRMKSYRKYCIQLH